MQETNNPNDYKTEEIHFFDNNYDYEVWYKGDARYSLEWEDGYDISDINIIKFFKILDNGNLEEILLNTLTERQLEDIKEEICSIELEYTNPDL